MCGIEKIQQTGEYNKAAADPQTERTNEWLPAREGGSSVGWWNGRCKLSGVRQAPGCIGHHGEYGQYFAIPVSFQF